jgi:ketosteroid isomerase-like protein
VKRSLLFILTLMLLATVSGEAFAQKKNKVKDKRYEPVARAQVKDYEGKYVGVEDAYFLEIRVAPGGEMSITSYEGERKATLKDIRLAGPIITATKIYTDSAMESFSGVFANRILNGDSAFGIIVDNVQVKLEGGVTLNGLFYRLRGEGASNISYPAETDINVARREIEARYALLAEAVRNKDFAAFQSLRTENFSTWPPDGEMMDSEQMAARARALLERIQAPISLMNEIETLILMDHEAIAIVHQKFSRMQEIEGRTRLVETSVTQRETWVKTAEGWKLKFVDNVHDQQTLVDGQRVERP